MKVRLGFASGGEEGLRMATASVPALILLDYQMPDCDGLEVLRRLRMDQRLARIPAMMITADKDQVLQEASKRLRKCVQKTGFVSKFTAENTVSRFGGDEFVVLLESILGTMDAERVASRILEAMRQPFLIAGRTLHLNASIGVVNCHGQYGSQEDVLRDADIAMYEAKDAGRGCCRIFDAFNRLKLGAR